MIVDLSIIESDRSDPLMSLSISEKEYGMICEGSFQSSGTHRQNSTISNKEYIQLEAFKFGALKNEVHSWYLLFGYEIYH